ncbi:von Willebrand factor type A domain-containing protein [Mycena pura]|uniref:von Willebrand factor type A domain-containing protein n=1 Tax=Mycena pura TaxID=153505 RepID=A0AAD6VCJ8_9AGAR|nr:von Willebrand factor type A domain-containing protein [Mycena pura]
MESIWTHSNAMRSSSAFRRLQTPNAERRKSPRIAGKRREAPAIIIPSHDTAALALSFVPRFKLPDVARQEFIFLVDRSGSMEGDRIAAARKALVVMLRSLPHKHSLYQIVSFGSGSRALWTDGSRPYNQETLEETTRHVDGMHADFGGTEIRNALETCFAGRKRDRQTSILVLTDGDAWDLDAVLAAVKAAVAAAPEDAPLRVSVLGIGDAVSTAMCEGIARVGNGTCMLVGEKESSFTGKIARLLKASRTPTISNISVDWGRPLAETVPPSKPEPEDDFEMVNEVDATAQTKKTLNVFDETVDPTHVDETPAPGVVLAPPQAVQQSPFKIRNLVPGVRLNVYAILQGQSIPKTVTLRGSTAEGAEIELVIAVTLSHLQNDPNAPSAIHALAARKIIQDLEDGQHSLAATLANDDRDLLARTVKASIVRLGKMYSISSTHTSFVAVDESAPKSQAPLVPDYQVVAQAEKAPFARVQMMALHSVRPTSASAPGGLPPPPVFSAVPGGLVLDAQYSMEEEGACFEYDESDDDMGFSFDEDSSPLAAQAAPMMGDGGFDDYELDVSVPPAEPMAEPAPTWDALETLARLQSFDGCFAAAAAVFALVKLKPGHDLRDARALFPAGIADAVVATVLAMAFMSTKLGADVDRDEWEGMHVKAAEYVREALDGTAGFTGSVESLEAEVVKMLA